MTGTHAVAQRIVNAENNFLSWVQGQIDCTQAEAEKVLAIYRAERIVKIDAVGGQFTLTNGVFAEADVLTNAVND